MTRKEFELQVDKYLLEVRAKLMLGWEKWRDSHAGNMSQARIVREIADESVDILGWAFWLWIRAQASPPFTTPPPR
jgi:hypothetical protein